MFFTYLGEVLKRAFTPTSRLTDGLQIAVASALPAATQFAGWAIAPSAENDALAYIGLVALSFIAIRFLWAPYDMWKEQIESVATLKIELSKPERLIVEHVAKRKAKNRLKIAKLLKEIYDSGFEYNKHQQFPGYKPFNDACALIPLSGLDADDMHESVVALFKASIFRFENKLSSDWITDLKCFNEILSYIDGRITIEDLTRRWPSDIELKIRP